LIEDYEVILTAIFFAPRGIILPLITTA